MNVQKLKIFYEWFLWSLAVILFSSFIILLVYFNNYAWIGITVVFLCWFLAATITTFFIFNSQRSSNVKLCWILCVMCIPFVGIIIFYWFGIFPFKKKKINEYKNLIKTFYTHKDYEFTRMFMEKSTTSNHLKKAFGYATNADKPISLHNDIKILKNAFMLYDEILNAVKGAKKFINIQTYIVKESNFFNVLADLLIKKAKDGVIVNLMYDWIGGLIQNPKLKINEMKNAGINVATFNTFRYNPFTGQTNYRSHRKCIVVDNEIAIYGGSNLSDDYFNLVPDNNFWKDINFKIVGEVVNSINVMFSIDWENYTLRSIDKKMKRQFVDKKEFYFSKWNKPEKKHQYNKICQFIESSPLIEETIIRDVIINIIGMATKRIWITTPYFYPSEDILNQLIAAAYAGIDVKIIVPGSADDKKYILLINRYNYKKLLDAGIKIYEYYGFMHGKEIIVDNQLALVGTFNFDHRSLYSNFETALLINNEEFNQDLTQQYEQLLKTSNFITKKQWQLTQTKWKNFKVHCLNLINPLF